MDQEKAQMSRNWKIAKDAWIYAVPCLVISVGFGFLNMMVSIIFFILFICIVLFFRIPPFLYKPRDDIILSPAYGKVVQIKKIDSSENETLVSIFMSVFNVHMNYAPVDGEVINIDYQKGSFRNAIKEEASNHNENLCLTINTTMGLVKVKQIAGLIARRIVIYVQMGSSFFQGTPFGLIKFGSRVDITLPSNVEVAVSLRQKVKGGQTIIGVKK